MSNWGIEDDTNLAGNADATPGPKALRDAYEAMKKQNQELQSGLAAVQTQLRDQAVTATLSQLGIPATAASEYKGEADPAKVREWATTMQSIFGGAPGNSDTPSTDTTTTPPAVTLEGEAAAQLQRMQEAGSAGTPLGTMEAAQAGIGDATDLQGLLSAWQNIK